MPLDAVVNLVDLLRRYRLLESAQLDELTRDLQGRFSDPRVLARELVQRGWLTPYQVNQIFLGKAKDLLLGSYVLLERLGEGGMGLVMKARHWKLGRIVALKLIHGNRLRQGDSDQRFQREIRAAAQLNHPHIVRAHDADVAGEIRFFVMDYVEGTDLGKLVKQIGPLPVAQACACVRQTALGLQHAHELGMVHRDIKPSNLLLTTGSGTVKILDMGLARLEAPDSDDSGSGTLTREGALIGTVDYMAPEQAMDSHHVDIRADLYSLGCTFYFLLTGRVPFSGSNAMEKLLKHREQEAKPVERYRADVPASVLAVVRKLMAKQPEARFQTPADLVAALESLDVGGDPASLPTGALADGPETEDPALAFSMTSPLKPPPGRSRAQVVTALAVSAAALLLTLGVLGWAFRAPPLPTNDGPRPRPAPADESVKEEFDRLLRVAERAAKGKDQRLKDDITAALRAFEERHLNDDGPELQSLADLAGRRAAQLEQWLVSDGPSPAIAPFNGKEAKALQQRWAAYLRRDVVESNSIGMKLVLIPPGQFGMGTNGPQAPNANPQHQVRLTRPYRLGVHEVTQAEYERVMGSNPSVFHAANGGGPGHPVEMVSWHDAVAFCRRLSELPEEKAAGRRYRLPTEAEWEFACRAGAQAAHWWGLKAPSSEQANFNRALKQTAPVDSFPANPFGLYHIFGNVFEWCADWYGPYGIDPAEDPTGPADGTQRVLRGGAWNEPAKSLRSFHRDFFREPEKRLDSVGFRVACEVALPPPTAYVPLFNGRDMEGWEGRMEYWSYQDGALIGSIPEERTTSTFLCSKKKYRDFELRFQVRIRGMGNNSGVQVRSVLLDRDNFNVRGPQADIGGAVWGSLYGTNFGGMMRPADAEAVDRLLRKSGFNDYHIRCVGKRITLTLNGMTTVDDDFPNIPDEGIIAWQISNGKPIEVTFREILIKDLTNVPAENRER